MCNIKVILIILNDNNVCVCNVCVLLILMIILILLMCNV